MGVTDEYAKHRPRHARPRHGADGRWFEARSTGGRELAGMATRLVVRAMVRMALNDAVEHAPDAIDWLERHRLW